MRRAGFATLLALLVTAAPGLAAERVVAAGGSITEVVYALGGEDRLIAVDATSQYPPAAEELPDVGYFRNLSAEPILALEPDLLLAVEGTGPAAALDQLRSAGLEVVVVSDESTPEGITAKIEQVATVLDLEPEGKALAADVERGFRELALKIETTGDPPKVLFLLSVGRGAPLMAGKETAADAIIRLAGGENAMSAVEGYKPLSPEAAVAAAPDVILCMDHSLEALGGPEAVLALPEVALTPAGQNGRLISMEGLLLLGFGPRTPAAARDLARALGTLQTEGG